jgi:hypothetical protein
MAEKDCFQGVDCRYKALGSSGIEASSSFKTRKHFYSRGKASIDYTLAF